jgi:hypothetical protein
MVGEMKNGRYVYYQCTGHKAIPRKNTPKRKSWSNGSVTSYGASVFSKEVGDWVTRDSHVDEKRSRGS